jgi:transposase
MDILYRRVAGLDLHAKTVVANIRCLDELGTVNKETRTFGTVTRDLLALGDWLAACGVTHVAMEATGVLWKPVWNLLDGRFELLLVNPRELKQVPGRKSDVKDCEWIAQLLQCGLLRSSFVPQREQRELRDLTRHRAQLQGERSRVANRIHKLLEDANIKLGCVASDILGVSGREMLEQLVAGHDNPGELAELARGKMRGKREQLKLALQGGFREHHRFMLRQLLTHLDHLDKQVGEFNARIEAAIAPFVDKALAARLDAIPGVNRTTIENVVAEIGIDMKQFPTAAHLASWAGICPGNEESAGKRKRRKTTKGNCWLRRALSEAAWAATHTHDSYFSAQYHRLAGRRGKKRALIAVAHALLTVLHTMLATGSEYKDLGADYFAQLNPEQLKRYLVKRLQQLGYQVNLEPHSAV